MALQHLLLLRVVTVLQLIHTISASNNTDSNGNITYPAATANLTFNYLDCVKVAYTTQWSAGVNLWLFCHLSTNSPWARYYQTYYNPLTQSGVYTIEQIGNPNDLHGILEFPTPCWFKVANASLGIADPDNIPGILGGNFTMRSVDAVAQQTWATNSTPTDPTSAASTTSHGSPSNTATIGGRPGSSTSASLSRGAKAGIGVGATIVGLLLTLLILYIVALRRRLRGKSDLLGTLKAMQRSRRRTSQANAWKGYTRIELDASALATAFEADDGRAVRAELSTSER